MKSPLTAPFTQISWPLFAVIALLGAIGIAMQYSAAGGQWQPWAAPQLVRLGMGWGLFCLILVWPVGWLMKLAYPVYVICLALLVGVEFAGDVGLGAKRWIDLGFMRIQPSEFMKPALILALARYFHMVRQEDQNHLLMLIPPLLMIAIPVLLILKEPNLGTATICGFIGVAMLFLAGLRWQYFAAVGLVAALMVPVGWQSMHDYQKQRVMTFLDASQDPLGAGYNITQSIIAIGSGGFSGKGFLGGSQAQLDFLPEKQTDFIFTMLAEEFGFLGVLLLLCLFIALLSFAHALCLRAKSRFMAMICAGVGAAFFAHMFINMAMVMGIVPVVGVPLPFLSYGGTFLLSAMILCGLLMKAYIHRHSVLHRSIG
jgi:rod shape determining protein RodA